MKELPTTDKLKEVLDIAERTLEALKDDSSRKAKRKRKRIELAVEKAYETLNSNKYTEKEIEKRTNDIWASMMDDDHFVALLIFFFSFILAGISIFVVYRAYTFINNKVPTDDVKEIPEGDISNLIDVEYKNKTIRLSNMLPVTDEVGLDNSPYEFTIKNDSKKIADVNYAVNYSVNINPENSYITNILDQQYIKYKYIYTNSWTGKTYESKIGTLAELPIDKDGVLTLMMGTQLKDTFSKFKVIFWLSSDAPNEQQTFEYAFSFKVSASIVRL